MESKSIIEKRLDELELKLKEAKSKNNNNKEIERILNEIYKWEENHFVIVKEELNALGISNYKQDLSIFMNDMRVFFTNTWSKNYHEDLKELSEYSSIEEFKNFIGETAQIRYEVLSNCFIGDAKLEEHKKLISKTTRILLKYYFRI